VIKKMQVIGLMGVGLMGKLVFEIPLTSICLTPIFKMEDYMNSKRLWTMAVLLVFLGFPVSASMVSFLLVETGLKQESPSAQHTRVWEGGLMEAFFDAGHIITNSPITRMEKKPAPELSGLVEDEFFDAAMGGADYFVLGFLEYRLQGNNAVPVGMALKIYDTDTKRIIYEQQFPVGTGKSSNEEYRIAQNAGKTMISHIKDR